MFTCVTEFVYLCTSDWKMFQNPFFLKAYIRWRIDVIDYLIIAGALQ